jgi:uncharacterized membrane protein YdjX (TVP38/TMEM64 family)
MVEKIRKWLVEQYFRIMISLSFISFLNFILLIIASSDKLKTFLPFDTITILILIVPTTILVTWFIGYVLDIKVKYMQEMMQTQTDRHPPLLEILERVKRIEEKLKYIEKKLS